MRAIIRKMCWITNDDQVFTTKKNAEFYINRLVNELAMSRKSLKDLVIQQVENKKSLKYYQQTIYTDGKVNYMCFSMVQQYQQKIDRLSSTIKYTHRTIESLQARLRGKTKP